MKKVLIMDTTGNLVTALSGTSPIKKFERFLKQHGKDIEVVLQNFTPSSANDSFGYIVEIMQKDQYDLYLMNRAIATMWGEQLHAEADKLGCNLVALSPTALAQTEKAQMELLKLIEENL